MASGWAFGVSKDFWRQTGLGRTYSCVGAGFPASRGTFFVSQSTFSVCRVVQLSAAFGTRPGPSGGCGGPGRPRETFSRPGE